MRTCIHCGCDDFALNRSDECQDARGCRNRLSEHLHDLHESLLLEQTTLHQDPLIIKLCEMIYTNAYMAWVCAAPGASTDAPFAWRERYRLISNPVVGDFVVEVSGGARENSPVGAVGTLIRIAREPCRELEEGEREEDVLETYYYLEDVTGREVRWENCHFIRAFRSNRERYEAEDS